MYQNQHHNSSGKLSVTLRQIEIDWEIKRIEIDW